MNTTPNLLVQAILRLDVLELNMATKKQPPKPNKGPMPMKKGKKGC